MATLVLDDCWTCETCGHVVLEDGCGFVFSDRKVRSCERCPTATEQVTRITPADPILNTAEQGEQ